MKKCVKFINKEEKIDRYCGMKCDGTDCCTCVLNNAKYLIFRMEECNPEESDCTYCKNIYLFRKILNKVNSKLYNRTR